MLKIYNTLTRKKQAFKPRSGKKVNMFVCGPTVYDYSHIGHARTYVFFDVLAKTLRKFGYEVFYLQNITDIDDKIIERSRKDNAPFCEIARKYEKAYREDMRSLGITSVSAYARASDYIPQIIGQVERLMKRGYAYRIEDGIYFDIAKFKRYGKLSGRTVQQAEDAVSRIDESVKKKNKGDFCLWKFAKPGEPKWKSSMGFGRPGWHIEDTAISESFFGPQYDIHGGGIDLIFPHHDCEIAQQEAASGKRPFVKYWLHTGHLNVRGEKMSKSLGNFITIREALAKIPASAFRLLVLQTHWRSPLDYTDQLLEQARSSHERLTGFVNRLADAAKKPGTTAYKLVGELRGKLEKEMVAFYDTLGDDLNSPRAISHIFNIVTLANPALERGGIPHSAVKSLQRFFKEADAILGIVGKSAVQSLPVSIRQFANERERLRKSHKWHAADALRRKIEKAGWVIEDSSVGTRLKRK